MQTAVAMIVLLCAAVLAYRHGVGTNALAGFIVGVAVAALVGIVFGISYETNRELSLEVRRVNNGFIALASDLGLEVVDPGELPSSPRVDARFARVAGTYRNFAVSIAVDAFTTDELKTKVTLLLPRPAPKLSPSTFANLADSSELTDRWLALYVSTTLRWTRPFLTYDRLPESDPARLRAVLDRSILFVGVDGGPP